MNLSRYILFLLVGVFLQTLSAFAQPGFKVDIDKPKPYTERKLKAEKTGDGKLKMPKLFLQNLTTRFNYVFNANNKLNEIIDKAKEQHKDDYAQLLSFYSYDLDATAADSAQLDSVIYKARTGIISHDLRNEWTDELYLMWAAAWHLQKKFDSAAMMLQFINYAYAPQFSDGYAKPVGTHNDGDQEVSIATKEDKKFFHSNTFSRNTAFIWQIRTRVEMGNMTGAGSLITTLRRDPLFPKRLSNPLDEVEAYWNYRQKRWDSAAVHLLAALDGDYTKFDRARWTYLAAQLMENAGREGEALKLYEKVADLTPDPIMEVYARLNMVRLSKEGGDAAIDKNVAELLKMARKDKYEDYRDVIYFMAAQMEMERNNIAAANELLIKGSKYSNGNQASRNKAFLQIADVSFGQKKYNQAASFYDSVLVADLAEADAQRVNGRKAALQKVVLNAAIIERQDSLQRIAALPEDERKAVVKAMLKKLRKQQGLKEEPASPTGGNGFPATTTAPPADLFQTQQKGEWYFYNTASKTAGSAQFKSVWGTRPNVDNWRRFAAVSQQILSEPDKVAEAAEINSQSGNAAAAATELSMEGLTATLPLTPEGLKASNDSIRAGLFDLGTAYLNNLEDYPSAIATFEELRKRFPDAEKMDEVLFDLFYAYTKNGDASAAAQIKKLLGGNYPTSRFNSIASTGKDPQSTTSLSQEATKAYENVYNLYIEGRFAEAETAKHIADSTYKTNYWQPQLLYIEAVYYIRQRQDSVAKDVLQTIVKQNSNKVLTEKAQTMIDVLGRRQQIEDELTRLQITRPSEDDTVTKQPAIAYQKPAASDTVAKKPVVVPKDTVAVVKKPDLKRAADSIALSKVEQQRLRDSMATSKAMEKRLRDSLAIVKRDSLALARQQAAKAKADSLALKTQLAKQRADSLAAVKAALEQARRDSIAFRQALAKQATDSLALRNYFAKRTRDSLDRITKDSLALVKKLAAQARADSMARKMAADKKRTDSIALVKAALDQRRKDSLAFAQVLRQRQKDSLAVVKAAQEQRRLDSLSFARVLQQRSRDSLALARLNEKRIKDSLAKIPGASPEGYVFSPAEPHYAVVVLDKVDPIFVGEARNAFFRYNKEKYYSQPLDVQILDITADTRLLLISGLPTAAAATDYLVKAKPLAATEIIPWLTGNKYSFSIISASNLQILKTLTDVAAYKRFLEQHLPGKF